MSNLTKLKFLAFSAIVLLVLVYLGFNMSDRVETTPCMPEGMPGRCYHVSQDMCELIWGKAETSCKDSVQKLNLPPGRLTGPYVNKCKMANFDRAFIYARKSSPECDNIFLDLEDWRRRNGS